MRIIIKTLALGPVLLLGALPARAATPLLPGYFSGYGAAAVGSADIGTLALQLTHLANQGCPCAGTNGKNAVNSVGPITIPGLFSTTETRASARGSRTATSASAEETATLSGVTLLGGLVRATAIRAAAGINVTAGTFSTNAAGTHIVGLSIAGQKIPANTPPNTTIAVPGLGSATIYSETTTGDGVTTAGINVDAVLIKVTQTNSFGLPVGATLALGHASTGYNRTPIDHVVAGYAFVADASAQAINVLPDFGKLGSVGIGDCAGTQGVIYRNSTLALNEGPLSIGAGATTATGGPTGKNTSFAQTTASLLGINLLGGLIGASSIVSEATETAKGNVITASTQGTQFGGLTIAGTTLPADVPPNTRVLLPLLGYVIVNEQTGPSAGQRGPLTVTALDIFVTTPNLMGLPVGTEIQLASANAYTLPLVQ